MTKSPAGLVRDLDVESLRKYLSSHPSLPKLMEGKSLDPADAVLVFGGADTQAAIHGYRAWKVSHSHLLAFTGGVSRYAGPVLTEFGQPEAVFLAAIAHGLNNPGIAQARLVVESTASHDAAKCELGYAAICERLGGPPRSLILVFANTTLRRRTELFQAFNCELNWPDMAIQVRHTFSDFDLANPAHRKNLASEILDLHTWSYVTAAGVPLPPPQMEVPGYLLGVAERLMAESAAT